MAVVKSGEVILAEGYGFADVNNKIKMTADHILPIGSSSKSFTAASLALEPFLKKQTPKSQKNRMNHRISHSHATEAE